MSFWGVEVKPGKPYTHTHSPRRGRLRLTQATLGCEVGKGEKGVVLVQCSVKNKDPVFLCALVPGQSETCHLELEFEEKFVTFSVLGPRSVHLVGYYVCDVYEDMCDSDTGSDSLRGSDDDDFLDTDDDDNMVIIPVSAQEMSTDSEDDDSDYDSETDNAEMMYNKRRGKSSVIIEEIQEDDKPAGSEVQKGSNKKRSSENGDNYQLQHVVRTPPAESLESEDEDGFPVSFPESKKSAEGSSKKNRKLNNETSNEDRKRKSGVISDHRDSSGEVKAENDGVSKKKKANAKRTAVDSEEKESKPQDPPGDPVDAKQKKKKNTNISASETDTDQQVDKENHIDNDAEEVTAQEAKKKKKKKIQEKKASENQASTDLMESKSKKQPLQTRTFGNGLIIQEVVMGKPDGKKASNGKKVSVKYIGKLKNGTVFYYTADGRQFEFRLGVGQVIKGWDIGINGMRVGDKRRLTIPPSMGYGNQRVGSIPQNSTLVFDVELVNVK